MWWWFIVWLIIIFLLLSGSGFYGYRRSYYGAVSAIGLLILLFVLFWLAAAFAAPMGLVRLVVVARYRGIVTGGRRQVAARRRVGTAAAGGRKLHLPRAGSEAPHRVDRKMHRGLPSAQQPCLGVGHNTAHPGASRLLVSALLFELGET